MTRFKLDENLPLRAALVLRQAGHDASTVIEEGLGGASDTTLAEACADEDLVLLTLDLDFADIRTYGSPDSPGVAAATTRAGVAPFGASPARIVGHEHDAPSSPASSPSTRARYSDTVAPQESPAG